MYVCCLQYPLDLEHPFHFFPQGMLDDSHEQCESIFGLSPSLQNSVLGVQAS